MFLEPVYIKCFTFSLLLWLINQKFYISFGLSKWELESHSGIVKYLLTKKANKKIIFCTYYILNKKIMFCTLYIFNHITWTSSIAFCYILGIQGIKRWLYIIFNSKQSILSFLVIFYLIMVPKHQSLLNSAHAHTHTHPTTFPVKTSS